MEFNTLLELRDRLDVALTTKAGELKEKGIVMSNDDIWNYLSSTKWKNAKGLTLFDMVEDILKLEM